MKLFVQLPIRVYLNNMGVIFQTNDQNTSDQMKHVHVHYHLIWEYVEDEVIKGHFVKSSENDADLFMKNVTGDTYGKQVEKSLSEKYSAWLDPTGRMLQH